MAMMTTEEFAEKTGLSKHQLHTWLESGLLEAKTINDPDGPSQEFDASHSSERGS
jgi:DNA-binding transcriptional MerR regulator